MKLEIEIFEYWHIGSGHGSAGDLDAIVLRDRDSLPYLPGRSLKGLLRDACILLDQCETPVDDTVSTPVIFGLEDSGPRTDSMGAIHWGDARLPVLHRNWLNHGSNTPAKSYLFDTISATALDGGGVARDKSLRKFEVALPMKLEAEIDGLTPPQRERLERALPLVRELGKARNRGLGRCRITRSKKTEGETAA